MGKDIQQHLRIGIGIEVPQVVLKHFLGQLLGISEITVMGQGYAVGRIYIERLGQGRARAARCGITHVAHTHRAFQALHMMLAKNIAHQAHALAQAKLSIAKGNNPRCVLATMLKYG